MAIRFEDNSRYMQFPPCSNTFITMVDGRYFHALLAVHLESKEQKQNECATNFHYALISCNPTSLHAAYVFFRVGWF